MGHNQVVEYSVRYLKSVLQRTDSRGTCCKACDLASSTCCLTVFYSYSVRSIDARLLLIIVVADRSVNIAGHVLCGNFSESGCYDS